MKITNKKTLYNFKLINNYYFVVKINNLEKLLNKLKIFKYSIINEKSYFNFNEKLEKKLLDRNNYYIFNFSNYFIKENLNEIIKTINKIKSKGYKIIFLGPNKSLSSFFNYILIDNDIKDEIPYIKENIYKKNGILKNTEIGFYLDNFNIYLYNRPNQNKIFELYFVDGLNIYAIKDKRFENFILLNDKNVINILKSIFIYHPLIGNFIQKIIPSFGDFLKYSGKINHILSDIANLLSKIENYNYSTINEKEVFKHLINILNKYNIDIQQVKLEKLPYIKFNKIK